MNRIIRYMLAIGALLSLGVGGLLAYKDNSSFGWFLFMGFIFMVGATFKEE